MPLTAKGEKILAEMQEEYGAEKGEQVFYAAKNKGLITGVDARPEDTHRVVASLQDLARAGGAR